MARAVDEETSEASPLIPESIADREVDYSRAILLFIVPALGGLLFGYDIGATSGAISSLKSATLSGTDWYELSAFQEGLAVSCTLLGAMGGSVLAALYGTKLGRKSEHLLASGFYGTGAALTVFSDSYGLLCAARVIYGLGVAFAMHGGPSYIAETSPSSLRGIFISMKEALIVVGILLGYLASFVFVDTVGGWRWNYGVAFPVILLYGAGMVFLPESPRILVLKDKLEDARRALASVCGQISNRDAVVESEIATMQTVLEKEAEEPSRGLFQRRNWKALYITVSLVIFQQATGQPSVLYYAQEVFERAKIFSADSDASAAAVALGVWKLFTTVASATRIEQLGRRPLLLYGVGGLTGSLVVLSLCDWLNGIGELDTAAVWGSVAALFVYVGSYQLSFGPIVWLLVGELYPLRSRTEGIALCTFTNFGVNFIVSLLFPVLSDTIGLSAEYLVFALIGVAALVSIYKTVPETKGKSLEEIEALLSA